MISDHVVIRASEFNIHFIHNQCTTFRGAKCLSLPYRIAYQSLADPSLGSDNFRSAIRIRHRVMTLNSDLAINAPSSLSETAFHVGFFWEKVLELNLLKSLIVVVV